MSADLQKALQIRTQQRDHFRTRFLGEKQSRIIAEDEAERRREALTEIAELPATTPIEMAIELAIEGLG